MHTSPFDLLFAVFSAVLGAAIGSFLNVCIYRMPRDLSVSKPSRSFCPSCKYQIPWYHNVPLVSWLVLRGKCANCGSPIAFRYFGVELLTGLLFLAVWVKLWPAEWILAFPYWIMTALFVVATFIDFEHFIIPDEITWGGAAAGVLLSFAIPPLHAHDATGALEPWLNAHDMGADSHLMSGVWALAGAALGYASLWAVVELGKKAFGKKRLRFEKPEPFTWVRKGLDADLTVGKDQMLWSDFFARGNEQLLMSFEWLEVDGKRFERGQARYTLDWLEIGAEKWKLEETDRIAGVLTEVTFPREAMGMGDVKFMACIGAFLGWQGVVFTVIVSSLVGAVIGVGAIAMGRREWSAKIPFGPYLALAALLWVFVGPQMVDWYWHLAAGQPE